MADKELLNLVEITGKTLLSTIPVGGTLINSIWDTIKSNELQRRLNDWMSQVEKRLSNLEQSLNSIKDNAMFATAMVHSTELAIKAADRKKTGILSKCCISLC